jgi:hypothetical protein
MSDPWSPPTFSLSDVVDAPFANAHNRLVMSVDRLAFPHVSLGRVQLDLATELCVRVVSMLFPLGWFPSQMWYKQEGGKR